MDPPRPPLLKQLRPAHWVAIDYALTALMVLVYGIGFGEPAYLQGIPRWAAAVIVAAAVLPAALRRRWPRAMLALVVVSGSVATAISTSPDPALAAAFVMYLIPLRFPRREALWLLAGTLLVTAAGLVVFAVAPHGIYRTGGIGKATYLLLENGLLIAVAWMIGYSVRQQHAHTAALREQAERRAGEQLAEARRARSEERLQIARELHDVVAHTMSLIAVQAGVANYVVAAHPDEAARALSSIEEISRGALREMRALLGVLRAEGNGEGSGALDAGLVPAPGLADLDRLVERTAEAGVRVGLAVRGERFPLPAGLDLAAYRVVQEAITNVIKHAATDTCTVTVAYQEDALTLEVTDGGSGASWPGGAHPAGGGGHPVGSDGGGPTTAAGIAGMRERVGMYGGEFRAEPLPGRGFQVTARFPLAGAGLAGTELAGAGLAGTGLAGTGLAGTGLAGTGA
jgi:signal transduction histidine kinase